MDNKQVEALRMAMYAGYRAFQLSNDICRITGRWFDESIPEKHEEILKLLEEKTLDEKQIMSKIQSLHDYIAEIQRKLSIANLPSFAPGGVVNKSESEAVINKKS